MLELAILQCVLRKDVWDRGFQKIERYFLPYLRMLLSSPIACAACERTELLKTEIVVTQNGSIFLMSKYSMLLWYLWYVCMLLWYLWYACTVFPHIVSAETILF